MPTKLRLVVFSAICLLVISLITTYNSSLITAQTQSALERAQNDYNFQFTKYRDLQDEYTKAKASHLIFKTAVSKNDAYIATRDYLIQVVQLYLAFIALTEEHGNSINWTQSTIPKEDVTKLLSEEKTYLEQFKQKLANTKTLEELPPLANELEVHLKNTLEPKLNKTLAVYEIVEAESVFVDFNDLSRILDRVVIFKLRSGETNSILANWATEVKDIRDKTGEKLDKARAELASKKDDPTITKGDLEKISNLAQNTQGELKRSKPLFEELIRII